MGFSYYQASLVFEMIEAEHGFEAILAMLRGYRDGLGTEALVERDLGMKLAVLDDRFDAFMERRFGASIAAVRPRDRGPRPSVESLGRHVGQEPGDCCLPAG